MIWLWLAAVLLFAAVLLLGGYIAILFYDVKREVTDSPTTPMFVCDKHGPLPESCLLKLDSLGTEKPVDVCPLCFEDRIKSARMQMSNANEARR